MGRKHVEEAAEFVRSRIETAPRVGVVLGSGLGPLADRVRIEHDIATTEIPHYPPSTVEGHAGRFLMGSLGGLPVVMLKGRIHAYEGYDLEKVTLPIRLMARLGIEALVLTNAAGGIASGLVPGDVMLIEDHLNLQGGSPLEGANVDDWGPRFPDMTEVYDASLRRLAEVSAEELSMTLKYGVYASLRGPQYETPAEVRMLAGLGADAVGMSTVPEAIVARHMGIKVLGFSVISNAAAGLGETTLDHQEVVEAGKQVGDRLAALVALVVEKFGETS